MKYKISLRSTPVLVMLALLSMSMIWIIENTKVSVKEDWCDEKIQAAKLMQKCMKHIKQDQFAREVAMDNINDPNETGLIGQQFTEITSGRGSLPVKLSTTNPNFAAVAVQLFKDAGLEKGDVVALSFTGSFPAVNIAVCAAVEVLQLKPVLITSVTSSSWGANDPAFTWLDMQKSLYDNGLISFMPIACSMGGNEDIGMTLSNESRSMAELAITRNNVLFINNTTLEANIAKRMEIYRQQTPEGISAYVNVGGGVASFGSNQNASSMPIGLITDLKIKDMHDLKGTIFEMIMNDVPIINYHNLDRLLKTYELPIEPVPLPPIGEGKLFTSLRYDLRIAAATTMLLCVLLGVVVYLDKKQNKLGSALLSNSDTVEHV